MSKFDLEQAIGVADKLVYQKTNKNLTDVEITILTGAWSREEYDLIAAKNNYSTSYLSQDVAPKLWKLLTKILGEKVKKSNFREALKRYWKTNVDREKSLASQDSEFTLDTVGVNFGEFDDLYVKRTSIESACCQALSQPGALLRLKGSRLIGKTSLMNQVLVEMKEHDYAVVNLSLKLTDKNTHFTSLNRFLRWFCSNVSRELELSNQLDEYWDEADLGCKVSCTIYFQDYILEQLDRPLILCLDDVDLLFPYPEIYEDFFALLRSWYEKARTRKKWQNLRLALVHATDVYIRLNIYQSPFNVGVPQELPEFTLSEVEELATRHQLQLSKTEANSLVEVVGGHPHLLQQAFTCLKSDRNLDLDTILAEAVTESGIYNHHLREIWLDLQQNPELAIAFGNLLTNDNSLALDPIQAFQLQNIGLIKLTGNLAEVRCNLYHQFFGEHLQQNIS